MTSKLDKIVAESRKNAEARGHSYRGRALKMFPWVCTKCAREFDRSNLHELTVHHRDHNHENNPEDGSNWELLCLYCHDNEHARQLDAVFGNTREQGAASRESGSKPFANLKDLLDKGK